MNEIWKDIDGYEGLYKVSNLGRIKSLGNDKNRKEKILKTGKNKFGYLHVILCKEGKVTTFRVQRLVANAFIPNPENKPEVNHIDENKENNCVWNLEWCTHQYNNEYSKGKKILCVETNKVYPSAMEAQRQTVVHQQSIIACCKGKLKTTGNYHWKYETK